MIESNRDRSSAENGAGAGAGIPNGPVAVVLAGAGARGAYEAGYVATLLPHIEPRPTIFLGTSAGAINAALLASVADRSPESARDEIIRRWSSIRRDIVLGPIWRSVPVAVAKYASALLLGTAPPTSFLDTEPLSRSLREGALIDWQAIHDNVSKGRVHTLGVVATESGSGRTKVFYESSLPRALLGNGSSLTSALARSAAPFVQSDDKQAIDYVRTELTSEHVRASAAIPVLFPPVAIEMNARSSYFLDGGVRLNAPLKPALRLGARGLVVISTDPRRFGTSDAALAGEPPSMQDQVLQIMRGIFADRMIEDIRTLLDRNQQEEEMTRAMGNGSDGWAHPHGKIPLIFGGPQDQDRVGSIAARAIQRILHGPSPARFLGNLDLALLDRATSVSTSSGPDILSYVLFEPEFIEEAVHAGVQDAAALLNDYPEPEALWRALSDAERRRAKAPPKLSPPGAGASPPSPISPPG